MLKERMIIIRTHSRTTDHPSGYFILDRVRALYHWVIEETKIDLRRKYIDNDDKYKKVCW